ncbi:5-methylcytosine restriction system specificity protein McrC [Winogradskyella rapida]|uniref:5-methylcytosine-specific restriction enzyme subunit McrC n=1 Tax=Winogradskyella rapida TaxID=549701 RepID=A0ABW3KQ99_9FLAO
MESNIIYMPPVKDCTIVEIDAGMAMHINSCFTKQNIFKISNTVKEEELPLLTYDYKFNKWRTGRFIGKLFFNYNNQDYCFEVVPRFGNASVMHLLEEIFNIKLAQCNSSNKLEGNVQNELIKKLISFIWVKQLSKANVHGLPKNKVKKEYKSLTVKGRIDIRKSVLPIYNENQMVSTLIEKQVDQTIIAILYKAYRILCKNYFLSQNMLTDAVKKVVNSSSSYNRISVTTNQYNNIKYGAMYANYKSIVDFSWQIIQRKNNSISQEQFNTSNEALFLDMAEIWENYLMTILKKRYAIEGWKVYSQKFNIYKEQKFKRGLIPDIIIEKDNNVVVFDAKYKNMSSRRYDYDRSDFFQIHTYGSFLESQNKKIIGLGLIYPLQKCFDEELLKSNFSNNLYGESINKSWFKVDGIKLSNSIEELSNQKNAFLNRFHKNLMYTN